MIERIEAPWTEEQVEALNAFQRSGQFHPFTCGNDSDSVLIARIDGWHCPDCAYHQNWAHAFMAEKNPGLTLTPRSAI